MDAIAAAASILKLNVMDATEDAVEDVMVEDTCADSHSGISISVVDAVKDADSNANSQLSNSNMNEDVANANPDNRDNAATDTDDHSTMGHATDKSTSEDTALTTTNLAGYKRVERSPAHMQQHQSPVRGKAKTTHGSPVQRSFTKKMLAKKTAVKQIRYKFCVCNGEACRALSKSYANASITSIMVIFKKGDRTNFCNSRKEALGMTQEGNFNVAIWHYDQLV